jgi:hypothetical protein
MTINKFIIGKKDGLRFARKSRDFNKIHTNPIIGYNSIFGENIVHGVLPVLIFFKKILKKNSIKFSSCKINFKNPIFYNEKIKIKVIKKKNFQEYSFIQENKICTSIKIENELEKFLEKENNELNFIDVEFVLEKISYYVGMIKPGENSILSKINIHYKYSQNKRTNLIIKSQKLDRRVPIIKNHTIYKNFDINFQSIIRPSIIKKKTKLKKFIIKKVHKNKTNILIVGASQGIGGDILDIYKNNSKVIKIATYYKNKIINSRKDIRVKKINILLDKKKLNRIISKFQPLNVYYFATPKILFDKKISKKKYNELYNFYVNIPLKILSMNKKKIISFFNPSTTFIDFDKNAPYSKVKKISEIKIKNFCKKNKINYFSHRFPALNSRQSITILNPNNKNLNQYLNTNKKHIDKIIL